MESQVRRITSECHEFTYATKEMIAIKKAAFQAKCSGSHVAIGSKGFPMTVCRTEGRYQGGAGP